MIRDFKPSLFENTPSKNQPTELPNISEGPQKLWKCEN